MSMSSSRYRPIITSPDRCPFDYPYHTT